MNKKILILVTLFILLMVVAPSIVRYKDEKEREEKENGEMNISCPEGYIRVLSNEIVAYFENIEYYCKPESMKDKELEVWGGYVIRRCPEGYYPFNEKYCSKKDTGEYYNYNPIYNHDASPR